MAAAVEVFKENAVERQRLAAECVAAEQRARDQRRLEMHQFADQFERALGQIVRAVSVSATNLHDLAGMLAETAQSTEELAQNVTIASEDASKNVLSVCATTEEMTTTTTDISAQAHHAVAIAREAVAQVEKTNSGVSDLSRAGERIGGCEADFGHRRTDELARPQRND